MTTRTTERSRPMAALAAAQAMRLGDAATPARSRMLEAGRDAQAESPASVRDAERGPFDLLFTIVASLALWTGIILAVRYLIF